MADRRVKVVVEAEVGNYRKGMQDAGKATEGLGKSADKAGAQTEAAGKKADESASNWGRLSKAVTTHSADMEQVGTSLIGIGAGLTAMSIGAGKAAMDWESAWAGVTKTVDGTPEQLAEVEGGLRNLAKTLPATHAEIAGVAEAAGQLGVARDDVVGFTATMIDLGETTNLTADEAATNIAQISNVMGTMEREGSVGVQRFGAALVALGNDGASTEAEILNMAQRIAGAGATLGATEADVLALSNTLASMGVRAELGGGVATRVLLKMRTAVDEGGESLSTFASVAGVSADEFAAKFRTAPVEALGMVAQGINGVNEAGGNVTETMKEMGIKGTEETQVMLALANSGDLLTNSLELGARAWEENSALADEAAKRYETTESKIAIAWNQIKDAAIDVGGALLPIAATVAEGAAGIASAFAALPDPIKSSLGVLSGVAGVVALAAGGLLTLAPRLNDTVTSFQRLADVLNKRMPGATTALGKFGKAAGIAGGAAIAIGALATAAVALHNAGQPAAVTLEEVANQLNKVRESGDAGDWDELFDFDTAGVSLGSFSDALRLLDPQTPAEHLNSFGASVMGVDNNTAKAIAGIEKMDQLFATLDTADAAEQFNKLRVEQEMLGNTDLSHWSSLKEIFPEYAKSVEDAAEATGIHASEMDLMLIATGKVPQKFKDAATAAEDTGEAGEAGAGGIMAFDEATADAADAAEELADALDDALTSLREMGIVPRNAQAANDAYQASLDNLTQSIKDNGATLDANTEKGRANRAALREHTEAGLENAAAMLEAGAGQDEVSSALMDMYNSLIENADAMGLSKTEAEAYAKELLDIPTDVDVDVESEMDRRALEIAEMTGASIEAIPDSVQVIADMSEGALDKAFKTAEAIKIIPGYKRVDVAVDDQGTPGQIQSRVNAITGKTEYVFVEDDGTSQIVQQQILNIGGKDVPVYVKEDGTVVVTQGKINGIHGKTVSIEAEWKGGWVQTEINSIRGKRVNIDVVRRNLGQAALAEGGIAGLGALPRYSNGGRLPSYGRGTDTILGVGSDGVATAWVDDGEFVTRRSSTQKYFGVLDAINRDHPSVRHLAGYYDGGTVGREWSGSAVAPAVNVAAPSYSGPSASDLAAAVASQLPAALDGMKVVMDSRATVGALKDSRAGRGNS